MLKNKKIFIVEDNSMNRVVYMVMLNKEGYQVEFDRWGRNTIKKLSEQKFDLIILDLMLPQGDSGYKIFEKIRQLPDYDDVPIIAVSASDPSTAIPKAKQLGFSGFIAKPLDKNHFPKLLEKLFNGEEVWYEGERF